MAPSPARRRRVAVIGAGVSGLAAAKCLLDEGLEPVVYEQAAHIGGLGNHDETPPRGRGATDPAPRPHPPKQILPSSHFPPPPPPPDAPPPTRVPAARADTP